METAGQSFVVPRATRGPSSISSFVRPISSLPHTGGFSGLLRRCAVVMQVTDTGKKTCASWQKMITTLAVIRQRSISSTRCIGWSRAHSRATICSSTVRVPRVCAPSRPHDILGITDSGHVGQIRGTSKDEGRGYDDGGCRGLPFPSKALTDGPGQRCSRWTTISTDIF